MHPTLISIGSFSISSFGFLLSLAFVAAIFTVWRLSRVYDIDEEKTIDLTLLTFFGGLIGSRALYVLTNLSQFDTPSKMILLNRYPGLNFWGGVVLGILTLYVFSRRLKIGFYHMADFITVGFFSALILGSLGCLLGSCQYGFPYSGFLSVPQVGLIGNRFPTQLVEAIIFLMVFSYLWKMCLHFHFSGKVAGIGLILLGIVKFLTEFLRADTQPLFQSLTQGDLFALLSFVMGMAIFYSQSKRSLKYDLEYALSIFTNSSHRHLILSKLSKSWYNFRVNKKVAVARLPKNTASRAKYFLRNLNVKTHSPRL